MSGLLRSVPRPVWAVVVVSLPPFLTHQGVLTPTTALRLSLGVTAGIVVLSLSLLINQAGLISLGHVALLGIGAFMAGNMTARLHLSFLLSLVLAAAASGFVAFLVGLPAVRIRGSYLTISTLGLAIVAERFLFRQTWVLGPTGSLEVPEMQIASYHITDRGEQLGVVFLVLVGVLWLSNNVLRTKLGRAFLAIKENEDVAASFGIDIARTKLMAFMLSGMVAGVAGALQAHVKGSLSVLDFPIQQSLYFVTIAALGWAASAIGVFLVGFVFEILPQWLEPLRNWQLIIGAVLLLYKIVWNPGGIVGVVRAARQRVLEKSLEGEGPEDEEEEMMRLPSLPALPPVGTRRRVPRDGVILRAEHVSVRFGGIMALRDVSVSVPVGSIVGITGPNASGKSTLLDVIAGVTRPQSGRVVLSGVDVTRFAPHRRAELGLGRTFQQTGLIESLTVFENFLISQHLSADYGPIEALALSDRTQTVERELRVRAEEAIESMGLGDIAGQRVAELSGGQGRLVELGCALMASPDVLLLDEPTAGLSPAATESLAAALIDLRDELGRTVVLVEHHVPLIRAVCDELYMISFGKVLRHGSTDEVLSDPRVVADYLGEVAK